MWRDAATWSMRPCRPSLEKLRWFGPAVALVLMGACGGSHPLNLSAAPEAGVSPASTTTIMPTTANALCAVSTTETPPFEVTFRFRADGNVPVYVHKAGCSGDEWGVSSCTSGFAEPLGPLFGGYCG